MDVLSMRWADVLVASWPVDPEVVAGRLPDGVDVDIHDGDAYLSVVPFVMENIRPRGLPSGVGRTFGELNLRTYVTVDGRPGIYFFNLDATDALGVRVARRLFGLPYYTADMRIERRAGGALAVRSTRTHAGQPSLAFDATYEQAGACSRATPGSLTAFLLERYRFFVASEDGTVYQGTVDHDPWQLADATLDVRRNDLFTANGFEQPAGSPHIAYSPGVDVTAGLPTVV
ncbi:DUF2071 domain-containing protein [Halobacterium salinarum]|uniref:YqjF family protein n=1 Tax=Halobacterium salinarum TaxID=2242 RepID=UPI0025527BA3|nr:DUF2071 domain-containing protein [Halobacterium salinarum]MDL0130239.1 DUF2071 domain-containing protein [Halobacterium salinarum]MDL0133141.1 DUF2071 domain-containing protein [Halobacterium salinarum]